MVASYRFEESWHVPAEPQRVRDVVADLEHYPEWWQQVVAVAKIGPDDARVLCRSRLPYTLDLLLHAVSRDLPVIEVAVSGDLDGFVRWQLMPEGTGTRMEFEQQVEVGGPLGVASLLARPVLRWNHHRMMEGCRAGLTARLAVPPESSEGRATP